MVKHGICLLSLALSCGAALAQANTKAMLEGQFAVTCTPQNQRTNPLLVPQCQLWRTQLDTMEDSTDAEEPMPLPSLRPTYPPVQVPAPVPAKRPSAPAVNQCIAVRTNQWGSRQFFNGCEFTVNISWCTEEQGNAFSCKGGRINGEGLNFINPGSEQGIGGKEGRVYFVACRGGASGGVYASMKDGIVGCRP
jgi:hypothetical protein